MAVLGASGGIGQPLSLLLKNSPLVSRLTLYDIAHTPGVAADLSHIETRANVKGTGRGCLGDSTMFPVVARVWVENRIIGEPEGCRLILE